MACKVDNVAPGRVHADDSLQPITAACPDCDLINQVPALAPGESASCVRCDATLCRNPVNAFARGLALTFTAIILYAITCTFPFLSFGEAGIVTHTRLFSGIVGLYEEDMYFLAAVFISQISPVQPAVSVRKSTHDRPFICPIPRHYPNFIPKLILPIARGPTQCKAIRQPGRAPNHQSEALLHIVG